MTKSHKLPLIIVLSSVFLDFLGYGIVIPFLPFYAQKFGAGGFAVGLLFTSYAIAQFIFTPLLGRLSDRIGRRPLIIISLAGTAIYSASFIFAPSFLWLVIIRTIGGILGSSTAVAQAYISDVTPFKKRTAGMGYFGAAYGAGFIAGPALGSYFAGMDINLPGCLLIKEYALCISDYIAGTSLALPFIIAGSLALAGGLVAYFFMPESVQFSKTETKEKEHQIGFFKGFGHVFRQKTILFLIFLYFLGIFGFMNLETVFSIFSQHKFNLSFKDIGYFFSYIGLLAALIQIFIIPYISHFLSDLKIMLIGGFALSFGLLILPLAPTVLGYTGVLTIISFGIGLSYPAILGMISKLSHKEDYGIVMGVTQSTARMAQVFGSLWAGFAFEYIFPSAPILTGGLLAFLGFVLVARLSWKNYKKPFLTALGR